MEGEGSSLLSCSIPQSPQNSLPPRMLPTNNTMVVINLRSFSWLKSNQHQQPRGLVHPLYELEVGRALENCSLLLCCFTGFPQQYLQGASFPYY